jgi:hypothetical protein
MRISEICDLTEARMKDLAYAISRGAPNPLERKPVKPVSKHEALIVSLAQKSGKSVQQVTAIWDHAKQRYGTNWAQVTAQTKRELGL